MRFLSSLYYKVRLPRRPYGAVAFAVLVAVGIAVAHPAFAQSELLSDFMINVLHDWVIWPLAQILNGIISLLIVVSQYQGFAREPIVIKGWTVMRDMANMFFVFILLVIAIGTIVKWQVLNYRQNLRRLILMALLINFSRTITVFFIEISTAIMLTFLTAIQDALQGGFLTLTGLDLIVASAENIQEQKTALVTYLVAAIMVLITCIVAAAYLIQFVVRIVALWVLIIVSPAAFLASTLPQTERYYAQWWTMLGQNLLVGPVLSFGLWLAISIVATNPDPNSRFLIPPVTQAGTAVAYAQGAVSGGAPSAATVTEMLASIHIGGVQGTVLINFLFATVLLIFCMRLAHVMGAVGGSFTAKFGTGTLGAFKRAGKSAAVMSGAAALTAGRYAAKGVGKAASLPLVGMSGSGGLYGFTGKWANRGLQRTSGYLQAVTSGTKTRYGRAFSSAFSRPVGAVAARFQRRETGRQEDRTKLHRDRVDAMSQEGVANEVLGFTAAGPGKLTMASSGRQAALVERAMRDPSIKRAIQEKNPKAWDKIVRDYARFGVTKEDDKNKAKKRNLRSVMALASPQKREAKTSEAHDLMRDMVANGENLTRDDMKDKGVLSFYVAETIASKSKEDADKVLNGIPLEFKTGVIDGIKHAMREISSKKLADGKTDMGVDDKSKLFKGLRTRLIKYDGENAHAYAKMNYDKKENRVKNVYDEGKQSFVPHEELKATPLSDQENDSLDTEFKGHKSKDIGIMTNSAIKEHGFRYTDQQMKQALGNRFPDVSAEQAEGMVLSLAKQIDTELNEVRRELLQGKFEKMLKDDRLGDNVRDIVGRTTTSDESAQYVYARAAVENIDTNGKSERAKKVIDKRGKDRESRRRLESESTAARKRPGFFEEAAAQDAEKSTAEIRYVRATPEEIEQYRQEGVEIQEVPTAEEVTDRDGMPPKKQYRIRSKKVLPDADPRSRRPVTAEEGDDGRSRPLRLPERTPETGRKKVSAEEHEEDET